MGKAAFGRRRGWRCMLWCVSCACAGTWPRLWLQVRTLGRARSRCHRRDGRMHPELRRGKGRTYRTIFTPSIEKRSHQILWCCDMDNPPFVNVSALLICPSGGEHVRLDVCALIARPMSSNSPHHFTFQFLFASTPRQWNLWFLDRVFLQNRSCGEMNTIYISVYLSLD